MSGICGICEPGIPAKQLSVEAMIAPLALGGEQANARVFGEGFTAGVLRRWAGQQVAEVGPIKVAVDADFWNFREVANAAVKSGDAPPNCTSAELVAVLYQKHGLDFVQQLNGAFSIAIWDERSRRLILTLDRLGIKGLYWRREQERMIFATRVSSLRAGSSEAFEPDPAAVVQYFIHAMVPAPISIYRGVQKLEPGTHLIFEKGEITQNRYWDIHYKEDNNLSEAQWTERVREGIRAAVKRTASECDPAATGAYLSGGTDSSSVVAFMTEWHKPAKSFSIIFDDARYSEAEFAHATVERFGAEHHELRLYPQDAVALIDRITNLYDEPFANSSAIGGYYCAKMARDKGITTLLAGDGGDEIFAGNSRYERDRLFQYWDRTPSPIQALIRGTTSLLPKSGPLAWPGKYVRRSSIPNPKRYFSYNVAMTVPPGTVFEQELLNSVPPDTWLSIPENHYRNTPADTSELNRLLYIDMKMTLADNDLRKVIGTAEMADVQVRFPFLDHELVQLAAEIPARLKLKGSEKRYIFKKALSGILPDKVLYKKKHGFGVPIALWLLSDPRLKTLVEDLVTDSQTLQRGWFRKSYIEQLLHEHQHGHAAYYGENVWYLIVLELWQRQHLASGKVANIVR